MRYGGSNPPLCTTFFGQQMSAAGNLSGSVLMGPLSNGRLVVALVVLGMLGLLVWQTMEPGRYQQCTWLLLGFFAFRIVLARLKAR